MTTLNAWREVRSGVYVGVTGPAGVNVGLVVGSGGALLVEAGRTPAQGRKLRQSVERFVNVPLTTVVVTHWHPEHALGLTGFRDLDTVGHESVADRLRTLVSSEAIDGLAPASDELTVPRRGLVVAAAVDLGDRRVEIAHLGPGHTDGDLVVVVPDADMLFVGDLLTSAGPPRFGDDCFPDEWGVTLDGVIGLMTTSTQAVPGHGDPVDRLFAFGQRGEIAGVAGEIRRLFTSGVPQREAAAAGSWPYPAAAVERAVSRGYLALAASGVEPARPTLPLA